MHKKETLRTLLKKLKESTGWKDKSDKDFEDFTQELIERILEEDLVDESLELLEGLDVEGDWKSLEARISKGKVKILYPKRILKYAAIFIGVVSLGIGFVWLSDNNNETILSGMDDMYVTLDTGSDKTLIESHGSHSVTLPSGETVAVHNGDTLIYGSNEEIKDFVYNELNIPNGKMFTLVLSDRTKIYLNSGTRIKFPVKFPEKGRREVLVYGEAYFDVTKDEERPFVVNSKEVEIEVLGTQFNLSSYDDQNEVATVLVEGSVSLSDLENSKDGVLLKPGEKGAWNRDKGIIEVEEVDVLLHTGWVNGEVVYRNTPFTELLASLERTYNVKIENTNDSIVEQTFSARFNRNVEKIEDVLDALRIITPFEYEVAEGKKGKKKGVKIK
ncbi:MAG: FecR domain-containing protein [Flavobacteriaceae bacterium]|nr:FecR domain-containing protein [Flavobacteriaceae bacterium]